MIDERELLEKVKAVQRRLVAEDYDEILSYKDLEKMIEALMKEQEEKPG